MKTTLKTDHAREGHPSFRDLAGIYAFAIGKDGERDTFDIAELDSRSLTAFLKKDGGGNLLAENCVRALLGHKQISKQGQP